MGKAQRDCRAFCFFLSYLRIAGCTKLNSIYIAPRFSGFAKKGLDTFWSAAQARQLRREESDLTSAGESSYSRYSAGLHVLAPYNRCESNSGAVGNCMLI